MDIYNLIGDYAGSCGLVGKWRLRFRVTNRKLGTIFLEQYDDAGVFHKKKLTEDHWIPVVNEDIWAQVDTIENSLRKLDRHGLETKIMSAEVHKLKNNSMIQDYLLQFTPRNYIKWV